MRHSPGFGIVAERVSSQLSDAGGIRGPLKRLPHTSVGIRQPADLHGTCKDPISISSSEVWKILLPIFPWTTVLAELRFDTAQLNSPDLARDGLG